MIADIVRAAGGGRGGVVAARGGNNLHKSSVQFMTHTEKKRYLEGFFFFNSLEETLDKCG